MGVSCEFGALPNMWPESSQVAGVLIRDQRLAMCVGVLLCGRPLAVWSAFSCVFSVLVYGRRLAMWPGVLLCGRRGKRLAVSSASPHMVSVSLYGQRRHRVPRFMTLHLKILPLLISIAACTGAECLPEPQSDATPPGLQILVEFTPPGGVRQIIYEATAADSASGSITADRNEPVRLIFIADDSSGVRRLSPAVTVQRTVGIGIERQYIPIDAVTSSCPRPVLRTDYKAQTSGDRRVVIASAVAENWVGVRSTFEPLTIRMN